MLLPRLTALLLAASCANAFETTSPFFALFSEPFSSKAALRLNTPIALNKDVKDALNSMIMQCDRRSYYFVAQEAVTASDLRHMTKLQERIAGADKSKLVEIPEVVTAPVAELSVEGMIERLEMGCNFSGKKRIEDEYPSHDDEYQLTVVRSPALPSNPEARAEALASRDTTIAKLAAAVLEAKDSAVLVFISTPASADPLTNQDSDTYEMDEPYPSPMHTSLKRDTSLHARQSDDADMQAGLPLFEKYQFLSPPIFMGLSVSLLLLLILYVGMQAISGLEVSYMAFNKEMGPQANKPKQ